MKILIAYDGSECSDAAIVDLRRAGLPAIAEALVLSVAEIPSSVADPSSGAMSAGPASFVPEREMFAPSPADELKHARTLAARAADRVRADFPGWHVSTEAWVDSAGSAIIRKAHAWQPDLIVLGSHGLSGINRLVLGSVSQHVLHHVRGPVRISRHRLHSQERPVRLVIGADGSADAAAALRTVATRSWPIGTQARIVGVMDTGSMAANPITLTREAVPRAMEENWQSCLSKTVHAAATDLEQSGLAVTSDVLTGKADKVLLDIADQWAADCVFVGARGLNRLERLLLGSVSSEVAAHAHCSVEVVRQPLTE